MQISDLLVTNLLQKSFKITVLAHGFQVKSTKTQNLYVDFWIMDRTGEIIVRKWNYNNEDENFINEYSEKAIVDVSISKRSYNNRFQYIVEDYKINPNFEIKDFIPRAFHSLKTLSLEFERFQSLITDPDYHKLITTVFSDPKIMQQFKIHRAAVSNHHNVYSGLLWHTTTMLKMAEKLINIYSYTQINSSLLYTAIIFHDFGKLYEISEDFINNIYTIQGRLIGHITIGVKKIDEYAQQLNLPQEKIILLQHCVLASHGKYEFGSPVHPATIEAFILSRLDDLDAKINAINTSLLSVKEDGFTVERYPDFASQGFYRHNKNNKSEL